MKTIMYISALVLLAACKKEKITPHTTVTGQVVSEYDGRPVPNATVFLITEERGCLGNMGCAKQVMTTQADADGKYSFAFDWVNDNFYSVEAQASWHRHLIMVGINDKGKENTVNVKMIPVGVTKIRLKNTKHNSKAIYMSDFSREFSGDNVDTTLYKFDYLGKGQSYRLISVITLLNKIDSTVVTPYPPPPPLDTATQTVEIFY